MPQAQEAKKKAEKDKAIAAALERAAADYEDGAARIKRQAEAQQRRQQQKEAQQKEAQAARQQVRG